MKFYCKNCGCQLIVPKTRAGKEGKCPKCKTIFTIPKPRPAGSDAKAADPDRAKTGRKSAWQDITFLDATQKNTTPSEPITKTDTAEEAYERLRGLYGGLTQYQADEVQKRRLPWIIDIFLYPLSKAGMTMLLIGVGIPLLLRALAKFCLIFSKVFPPGLVLLAPSIVLHWLSFILFTLYLYWYACECIRDSAAGRLRAPEIAGIAPSLGDILGQTLRVTVCLLIYMAPALLYLIRTQRNDAILWIFYGAGAFLLPMGLLAVIMFDSLRAVNPVLVLGSILSTFFQYCALVVFCYLLCLLIPVAARFLFKYWILGYLLQMLAFYQMFILAHLLGRFYWKYQDKLNWEA